MFSIISTNLGDVVILLLIVHYFIQHGVSVYAIVEIFVQVTINILAGNLTGMEPSC